jgi:hypothetical protein
MLKIEMSQFMDVFKWVDCEQYDQYDHKYFYDCTLLRKIGDYEAGTFFKGVNFNDEKMILEFYLPGDITVPTMVKSFRLCE